MFHYIKYKIGKIVYVNVYAKKIDMEKALTDLKATRIKAKNISHGTRTIMYLRE